LSFGHAKSKRSSNIYIVAAILMFIQAGILLIAVNYFSADWFSSLLAGIAGVFGLVFLGGAFFARTGTGVTATTERHIGGGWYERGSETANAITCGCMSGIGSMGLTIYAIMRYAAMAGPVVYAAGVPGIISSLLAMFAGFTALMSTRDTQGLGSSQGTASMTRACPFCGKGGLSPAATACPSCGQPLE
jgi:hypothetical protein